MEKRLKLLLKTVLFCTLTIFSSTAPAQPYFDSLEIDSLKKVLGTYKEDTNKVNALNEFAAITSKTNDTHSRLQIANEALNLAEKLGYRKGIADAHFTKGNIFFGAEDYNNSVTEHAIAIQIRQEINDKAGIINSYLWLGYAYLYQNNLPVTFKYLFLSLKVAEEIKDTVSIIRLLIEIGKSYENQEDSSMARKYFRLAVQYASTVREKESLISIYSYLATASLRIQQYQKALEFATASLKKYTEKGYFKNGFEYVIIGWVYKAKADSAIAAGNFQLGRKHYLTAITNYQRLEKYCKLSGDKGNLSAVYIEIANAYLNIGDHDNARIYFEKSLRYSTELGWLDNLKSDYKGLYHLDSMENDYRKAFENYKLYILFRDSLTNKKNLAKVEVTRLQYEFDKKEAIAKAAQDKKDALATSEIQRQTLLKNTVLGGVGVAGVFSFLLVWSFNRRRKTIFQKQVSQVEMKALRAQMNPHFIFNSLHSINTYIIENDKEIASEYLAKFSGLMRLILENSREQEVTLEDDLTALELYLQLESLRVQKRFQYTIEVDPQIDKESTLIPPMLLQPFVENSLVHGITAKENGRIKVVIKKEDGMMRCIVEDNGAGREQSAIVEKGKKKKHESLAVKITQERLQIINQLKKAKAAINIFDLKDEENKPAGLKVELILPFETAF